MEFANGQTVFRDRRRQVVDPYNPAETRPGTWSDPVDTITIAGAFVASSSSSSLKTETRSQILTAKSLFCSDPTVDVQPGDRIRYGTSEAFVHVTPEADVNPFTGWQPVKEIPLEEVDG